MMNTQRNRNPYGAELTSQSGQLLPGSSPVGNQAGNGRQSATGTRNTVESRRCWSRQDNINAMECYFLSQPEKRGYMKRMHQIWKERRLFSITDQRIADQIRVINRNGLMSKLEIEEVKRRVMNEPPTTETEEHPNENGNSMTEEEEAERQARPEQRETVQTEHEREIIEKLKEIMTNIETMRTIPRAKKIPKAKIRKETAEINHVIGLVDTTDITQTNNLILAGAQLVFQRLNAGRQAERTSQTESEPPWKQRLEKQVESIRKDLGKMINIKEGRQQPTRAISYKYRLKRKGVETVIEELKQRLKSTAAKIKRYSDRVNQYHENHLFETDQKRFYQKLKGEDRNETPAPEPEAAIEFWSGIWGREHEHNRQAGWIKETKMEMRSVNQQEDMEISAVSLKKVLGKLAPWKAAGPDGVQGYWVKNFSSLHDRLVTQLSDVVRQGKPPEWMTTGRTVLIPKDPRKGNIPSNYRPITCLPIMYKALTAMISESIYRHLEEENLIPWEQKGCGKRSRGTKDQLIIDKYIMKDSKNRKTNLMMAWIDYKKAYDMVPHSWITSVLEIVKVAENTKKFIKGSMEMWNTILESERQELGRVHIKRGIFQGDSLSPLMFVLSMIPLTYVLRKMKPSYTTRDKNSVNHLLYMDDLKLYGKSENDITSLINTVRIYSNDIGMEFGLDKCATIILKRGKLTRGTDIQMPEGDTIHQMEDNEEYKYLGILEADDIKHEKMKDKIFKEYSDRVKRVLKSKLSAGNLFQAINTWAVSLYRYGAGVVEWTKDELKQIDRRTRKLIAMHRGMHPRSDVDRLYVERGKGGRGLMSIEDTVKYESHSLKKYTEDSPVEVIRNAGRVVKSDEEDMTKSGYRDKQKTTRIDEWVEKPMNGQYIRQTKEHTAAETWKWMTRGSLKRETESLIVAAQDQALRTNYRKARIEKSSNDAKCRLCKIRDETISHLVSECPKIAQTEYKHRHDKVAAAVHWSICKKHGLPHTEKWYDHRAEPVIENEKVKLLWDFNVQTDKVIEARRPDLILENKETSECQIIDIAIPGDTRVVKKEEEKIDKYKELAFEIGRLWKVKPRVIPIVIGALGTISSRLIPYLAEIGVQLSFETIQKTALLGTAQILRKALQ
mgnify:FL=1